MSTGKKIIVAVAILILVEALTCYAYSLLWLGEGQPKNAGDPRLDGWARVCIGAMLFEFLAFLAFVCWTALTVKSSSQEVVR